MPLDQFVSIPIGPAAAPVVPPKGGSAFKPGGRCLARSVGAAAVYGVNFLPRNSVNSARVRGSDILALNLSEASFPGLANSTPITTALLTHINMLETVVLVDGVAQIRVGSDAAPGDGEFSIQDGAKSIGTLTFALDPIAGNIVEIEDTAGTSIAFEYDGIAAHDPAVGATRADSIANLVTEINTHAILIGAVNNGDGTVTLIQEVAGVAGDTAITLTVTAAPNSEITAVDFDGGVAAGTAYLTAGTLPANNAIVEIHTDLTPVLIATLVAGVTVDVEAYDVVTSGVAVAQLMG